jgi:hypothetical protein
MQELQDAAPCRITSAYLLNFTNEGRHCFDSIFMVKQSEKLEARRLFEKSADVYISTRHNISEALNLKSWRTFERCKRVGPTKAVGLL